MIDVAVEGDENLAAEQMQQLMKKSLLGYDVYRLQVKVSKLRDRRKSIQLGEFPPNAVLPYIRCDDSKREYRVGDKVFKVKMNSQRYFIFRESSHCAACGLAGTVMVLEQNPHDRNPHFNLYAVEKGKYILMTKDHVLPKAFGGEDRHSNYQTMCAVCNGLKGSENISLEGIRELRRVFNENQAEPKKRLKELLDEVRVKFVSIRDEPKIPKRYRKRYYARRKAQDNHLVTNIDINIWQMPCGTLIGRSVYEQHPSDGIQFACVREGTLVHAVGDDGSGRVAIKLSEDQQFFVSQGYIDYKDSRC
jgi:5-methylcytosine-specific restriction endonuclease McrA